MPASPEWRSVMKALSCAGAFCLSTISYLIFGRSKLATKLGAPASPSRSTISRRVRSSAVAVSAMRGTSGKRSDITDRPIYSGRKSWPHCDTQCASSIANKRDLGAAEQGEAARRQQPLGRDVEQIEVAGEQPRLDRGGFARTTAWNSAPPP